jgi:RNA polymerase sigma factor (sigma-70 family)
MNDSSPQALELPPDLLAYARAVALKEAKRCCPKHVDFGDAAQEALLHLMSKPPKVDPAKGTAKTLIHTIVQRAVLKYVERQGRQGKRFMQAPEPVKTDQPDDTPDLLDQDKDRRVELMTKHWTTDDVLEFIDNEECRALCRLFIDCQGNMSEVARRLGVSEGTVRYRMKLLAPKLLAAGFDPFTNEGSS